MQPKIYKTILRERHLPENPLACRPKIFLLLLVFLATAASLSAQTVIVTDNSAYTTGQASAVLDVYSIAKGFLAPRMTTAQRTAISSPATGLLVFQTDGTSGFYY